MRCSQPLARHCPAWPGNPVLQSVSELGMPVVTGSRLRGNDTFRASRLGPYCSSQVMRTRVSTVAVPPSIGTSFDISMRAAEGTYRVAVIAGRGPLGMVKVVQFTASD